MNLWNHSFDESSWDRYFPNRQRADEAWVAVLMDKAIHALLARVPGVPFLGYEKKDAYEYFYE